ncbi:MAG: exosome complex protein Rrp42 [Nanoarchaeota archaeon]
MKDIVRTHVVSLLNKDARLDGRKLDEYRKFTIEYGISSKSAEGSARVKMGDTEVVGGVKFLVGPTYPDTPDKGTIVANVELLPLSSPVFETGPPSIQSIEYARAIVDRGLRESDALDMRKLCIKRGEKMWTVMIDVYSINDAGNLADAIGLVAIAALKDAKFPKYDAEKDIINYEERTKKGLELKYLPIPITIVKIGSKFIIDPTVEEENAAETRLTVTTIEDGRACAIQKGGEGTLTPEDIDKMIQLSIEKGKELRKLFK